MLMSQLNLAKQQSRITWIWSGKAPRIGECPGIRPDGTIMSLPQVNISASRQEIRDYFDNGWTLFEVLFSALASEDAFFYQPVKDENYPLLYYFAHPAAFYIQKLQKAGLINQNVDTDLEELFTISATILRADKHRHVEKNEWPSLAQVQLFRKQVYRIITDVIEDHPSLPMRSSDESPLNSPLWGLFMGFEHERIHIESYSALIRNLPLELVQQPQGWPSIYAAKTPHQSAQPEMISLPACQVILGKSSSLPTFGWDNEYGLEVRTVRPFSASSTLITNKEFHSFVRAGGYDAIQYWSEEGWLWKLANNITMPNFWRGDILKPRLRTMFEEIQMPWEWPVIANYHEAKAYCAWRSASENAEKPYRLLSESEHQALRDANGHDANMEMRYGSECPVNAMALSDRGFYDVHGNVWQWAEDQFAPLTGSKPHPCYPDFSTPYYEKNYRMLFGGSFATTGSLSSVWTRMHSSPHKTWNAGFRVAKNDVAKRSAKR